MAAYTIYDVLRHLAQVSPWPSEEDRHAAIKSITEAEGMNVFGNAARNIECSHPELRNGRCVECDRTIEVGHSVIPYTGGPLFRQGWR